MNKNVSLKQDLDEKEAKIRTQVRNCCSPWSMQSMQGLILMCPVCLCFVQDAVNLNLRIDLENLKKANVDTVSSCNMQLQTMRDECNKKVTEITAEKHLTVCFLFVFIQSVLTVTPNNAFVNPIYLLVYLCAG